MSKKGPKIPVHGEPGGLSHHPFAGLARLRGPSAAESEPPATAIDAPAPSPFGDKLIVQREKKGRGGKTVTKISGFALSPAELETLVQDLKKSLGCGAGLEGRDVVLQGDQTKRVAQLLTRRGAKRVIIGN